MELLLSSLYGPDHADDENILVREADFQSAADRYDWITDATPKVNQTRYLARTSRDNSCIILFAPSVSAIDLHSLSAHSVPERITTSDAAGPGFKATKIIYQYDREQQLYEPSSCFTYFANEKPTPVRCSEVYLNP